MKNIQFSQRIDKSINLGKKKNCYILYRDDHFMVNI